jgi:hypothetical protein
MKSPIKKVFRWLPSKVYKSWYWQDGFLWMTYPFDNGDGRLYSSYAAADQAASMRPVTITIGPCKELKMTIPGSGGGCKPQAETEKAPAHIEAAIAKILNSPRTAETTASSLIGLIRKIANGQEV